MRFIALALALAAACAPADRRGIAAKASYGQGAVEALADWRHHGAAG